MSADFPVALILILGAALVPLLARRRARRRTCCSLPVAPFALLLSVPLGAHGQSRLFGQTLVLMRVDKLSLLFAYVFLLATLLSVIFALHVERHGAACCGAGLCRQRDRRGLRRRLRDAVRLLGADGGVVGAPDLGAARRAVGCEPACATDRAVAVGHVSAGRQSCCTGATTGSLAFDQIGAVRAGAAR